MANQEIKFTITKINNTDLNNGPIEIETNDLDFPTGKGDEKVKITKIFLKF